MIYMDYAATTPINDKALDAMMPYLKEDYGNASSIYALGRASRKAIEHAREQIASVINADPEEIYFTSGGTESNNWALNKPVVLTSRVEHLSVLKRGYGEGVEVYSSGIIDTSHLKEKLAAGIQFYEVVSIQMANNEIGTIQPVEEISHLCRRYGMCFHTDAVQAFGHIPIDVKAMHIDMLSASAHKFGGPKGVGILYVKKGIKVSPLIRGGHQEYGMRAGTENVAGIVGMGVAAEIAQKTLEARAAKERSIQALMIKRLREEIPSTRINGATDDKYRLPNNISITIDGVDGQTLVQALDNMGICISAGSACNSESLEPSHVLKAIGLTDEQALNTVRITVSDTTRIQEAHYTVDAIKKCVERLRKF